MMLSINIKESFHDERTETFLENLYQYDWDTVKTHQDANEANNNFILRYIYL